MNATSSNDIRIDPVRPRPRRWFRALLLSMLLLGSGVAIGVGGTLLVMTRGLQFGLHHPELFPARATHRLTSLLDLSDAQARQVETILRDHQRKLQEMRREVQPRIETHIDQIRDEIATLLTPLQAEKWQRWLAQKRDVWLPPAPATTEAP